MNIFEEVNKELDKLLEGDVVSFTDLKKAKEADKAILSEIKDTQTIYDEGLLKENENAED